MEGICRDSLKKFKRTDQKCSYLNEKSGSRCVNTKEGHSKGHQDARGNFLANGPFDHGDFTSREFLAAIKFEVHCILHEPKMVPLDLTGFLVQQQQDLLRARGTQKPFPHSRNPQPGHDCPLCIFGRPKYALPCATTFVRIVWLSLQRVVTTAEAPQVRAMLSTSGVPMGRFHSTLRTEYPFALDPRACACFASMAAESEASSS